MTISQAADHEGIPLLVVSEIAEKPGEGLSGIINGRRVQITGRKKVIALGEAIAAKLRSIE